MTHLKITGMTCDSCAAHVKEALEKSTRRPICHSVLCQGRGPARP